MFKNSKKEQYSAQSSFAWFNLRLAFAEIKYALTTNIPFDFVEFVEKGDVLLVGEGNLSFANSLSRRSGSSGARITATTFELEKSWREETKKNARLLRSLGVRVYGGVDATKLDLYFERDVFNLIIFQFPNVASRVPLYGRNPNHILMRRFLRSTLPLLNSDGLVAVTVVNTSYYDGVFDMDGAAQSAGLKKPTAHPFRFKDHPGYFHVNTQSQSESAVEKESSFVTVVFGRGRR
jgi:hypothetical protein